MTDLFTQISSGSLKGKRLKLPNLGTTRSTKSIVKGSFFDSYRFFLRDKIFVEGFGGSGVMAAEALSNGAKECFGIEINKKAFEILRQNFTLSPNLHAINADSFEYLPRLLADKKDIILYLDPPFNIREGQEKIYEKSLNLIENLGEFDIKLLAIEHISSLKLPQNIGKFAMTKSKKFGFTTLSYFEIGY